MAADRRPGRTAARDGAAPEPGTDLPVVVKRSARRRRTVSARLDAGTLVVHVPGWFSPEQEREWVETMRTRLLRRGSGARASDANLARRARDLSATYLGGRAVPVSIRWVDNQNTRWGSATPAHGTIRISRPVGRMPAYVLDYVVLHELAHLVEPSHGAAFWDLLAGYPHLDRARGYLDGYAAARGLPVLAEEGAVADAGDGNGDRTDGTDADVTPEEPEVHGTQC